MSKSSGGIASANKNYYVSTSLDNSVEEQKYIPSLDKYYEDIEIDVVENGFIVSGVPVELQPKDLYTVWPSLMNTAPSEKHRDTFILESLKDVMKWIEDHLAPTKKERKFLEGLDYEKLDEKNKTKFAKPIFIPQINQPFNPTDGWTTAGTGTTTPYSPGVTTGPNITYTTTTSLTT